MGAKKLFCALLAAALLTGCAQGDLADPAEPTPAAAPKTDEAVTVLISDSAVLVDGQAAPEDDASAPVYTAHDIVYYESGHDLTYGEGDPADEHDPAEAQAHTVVHIAAPGTYVLSGSLERGQIAVDLGEEAKEDPDAVVTLVLKGLDVTCTVAPAVVFYNVYECDPSGDQGSQPDLSGAGAAVVIADGSENRISGSYVARIYKSYTLNEAGTAVVDSKKLHKYDGAFYSKMSMTVTGGPEGTGELNITAENEGLDTEMHLGIYGGNINILSGNDGINVNEDGVSVVTIDGGNTHITVTGTTGEGDGIDSNGWLVINSGAVTALACSTSGDAGLDGENGVYLNGGQVIATGNMLDQLTPSDQCCALFSFAERQAGGQRYALTGPDGTEQMAFTAENDLTYLLMTSPALEEGQTYSLYAGQSLVQAVPGEMDMGAGGPGGLGPQMPADGQPDDAPEPPDGEMPEFPNDGDRPEFPDGDMQESLDGDMPEPPDGETPERPDGDDAHRPPQEMAGTPGGFGRGDWAQPSGEAVTQFTLDPGMNYFGSACLAQ